MSLRREVKVWHSQPRWNGESREPGRLLRSPGRPADVRPQVLSRCQLAQLEISSQPGGGRGESGLLQGSGVGGWLSRCGGRAG